MKYNNDTKELFTDNGILLNKMEFPEIIDWDNLEKGKNDLEKFCNNYKKSVLNTDYLNGQEVLMIIRHDRDKCLKVNVKVFQYVILEVLEK